VYACKDLSKVSIDSIIIHASLTCSFFHKKIFSSEMNKELVRCPDKPFISMLRKKEDTSIEKRDLSRQHANFLAKRQLDKLHFIGN
jgi:hypothetical protein